MGNSQKGSQPHKHAALEHFDRCCFDCQDLPANFNALIPQTKTLSTLAAFRMLESGRCHLVLNLKSEQAPSPPAPSACLLVVEAIVIEGPTVGLLTQSVGPPRCYDVLQLPPKGQSHASALPQGLGQ
eukprot:4678544-Amphidinium_carterae.2